MPIWKTTAITETPEIVLAQWRIYESDIKERHFVGYNLTEGEGRVSSAIQTFDENTMTGITRSGRVYKLQGAPGWNSDAEYTWNRWKHINSVESSEDVTNQVVHFTNTDNPIDFPKKKIARDGNND